MRRGLVLFFVVAFSVLAAPHNFQRIASIEKGTYASRSLCCGDSDHDGLNEIIFTTYHPEMDGPGSDGLQTWEIWEYRPGNYYERDYIYADSQKYSYFHVGDFGDIDNDGLADIVGYYKSEWGSPNRWLATFESPDYYSYPTHISWKTVVDTLLGSFNTAYPPFDLDKDGRREIFVTYYSLFYIYENVCNDSNIPVISHYEVYDGTSYCFGDFDDDAVMEFATGSFSPIIPVRVFKNIGDDTFDLVWQDTVGLPNGKDVFSGDTDGNGQPEFFIGFERIGAGMKFYLYEFKAEGINSYRTILIDTVSERIGDCVAISRCGDVDGDSIDEIVWSTGAGIYVYKWVSGNNFERVWQWKVDHGGAPANATVRVYDLNKNGYDEIVVSGGGKTSVFEIDKAGIISEPTITDKHLVHLFDIYPNPFTRTTEIRYQIENPGDVSLKIYNVSGRLVKTLIKVQSREPKTFSVVWDGRDDNGLLLPSDIYFCELVVKNNNNQSQRLTKKLVFTSLLSSYYSH